MTSFSVQTVEFVFKRSNFNSNEPISSRRVTTVCRPQRQKIVRVVPPGATAQPDFSAGGTTRPGQAPAPPLSLAAHPRWWAVAFGGRAIAPRLRAGWFQWLLGCISLSSTSRQLSLSLSPTTVPAAGCTFQPTGTSVSATSAFSLLVSTTIPDLTISEFNSWTTNLRKQIE
jgi:hypothetical protein